MLGGLRIGGGWDWSAIRRVEDATLKDSSRGCTIPTATPAKEWLAEMGWPTTSRVDGIALQHCIACCAVAIGAQSNA
jgi:hypothetical protein